jgi:putative toxin-antitoxin system antitoxin component (TIGR02293 family)
VTNATALAVPPYEGSILFKRLRQILGDRRLRTELDLLKVVEDGLPMRTIATLRRAGLTDHDIQFLIATGRTLARRRARGERLSREESDRAVRVARLLALCEEVFGDRERCWRWLRMQQSQLEGQTALRLMATESGARLVEELLYRIDDGVAAWVIANEHARGPCRR